MPAIGVVYHSWIVDEVFVGESEGDDADEVNSCRDTSGRGLEALEGVVGHYAVGCECHCCRCLNDIHEMKSIAR